MCPENNSGGCVNKVGVHEIFSEAELQQDWQDVYITSAYLVWCPATKVIIVLYDELGQSCVTDLIYLIVSNFCSINKFSVVKKKVAKQFSDLVQTNSSKLQNF